jgi:hypothetical protein
MKLVKIISLQPKPQQLINVAPTGNPACIYQLLCLIHDIDPPNF